MQLAKYMENDSRQHMASGYQRTRFDERGLGDSKMKDVT